MFPEASGVALTKVRYYGSSRRPRDAEAPAPAATPGTHATIIRHNVFGHRWVLKINETAGAGKKAEKWRIAVYLAVSSCILVAVGFGVYVSVIESMLLKHRTNVTNSTGIEIVPNTTITSKPMVENVPTRTVLPTPKRENLSEYNSSRNGKAKYETVKQEQIRINETIKKEIKRFSVCNCTSEHEVCLKRQPLSPPVCVAAADKHDPSGCGGHCALNTQFCKLLDKERGVYECIDNKGILRCPEGRFSCGDMCVDNSKRCDGFRHCKDNSDERNCECNLKTHFHCGKSTSCLPKTKKCDGRVDCWDRFDETDCNRFCDSGEVPCIANGQCIARESICDGTVDCTDGSDEPSGC